jgi:hypothetical protein
MFEWLEMEISAISTPRFHLVDGSVEPELSAVIDRSSLPLPSSYRKFVLKFGNAKLYRVSRTGYLIGVFAGPREVNSNCGIRILHLGFHNGASVYVKLEPGANLSELPIFEYEADSEERVADDFEQWLTESCARARNGFGKKRWADILRGPEPFTAEEEDVIETRRQMHWRMLGVDMDRRHVFEITNTSTRTLPVLTVGVRSRDGRLNGAIFLKVGNVGPGQTAVLHAECYRDLRPPDEIETFLLPDPQPEDRDFYGEFRSRI